MHEAAVSDDAAEFGIMDRPPQQLQRLPQVRARVLVVEIFPEQARKSLARLGLTRMAGEIGQQGLCLPSGELDRRGCGQRSLKATEQAKLQMRHLAMIRPCRS